MTRGATLAVAATLSLLAPAGALATATYVVDPASPGPCDAAHVCPTLASAVAAATSGTDTIQVKPGVYAESVETLTPGLTIMRFPGATGTVTLTGNGTANPPLRFRGSGPYRIDGLQVIPTATNASAIELVGLPAGSPQAPTITQHLTLNADVLSGGGQTITYGLSVAVHQGGSAASVDVHHTTFADRELAAAVYANAVDLGAPSLTIAIRNSIVAGGIAAFGNSATGPVVTETNDDSTTSRELLFVDPFGENFHLLASAPNVLGTGGTGETGEPATDIDGDPRPTTGAWDKGADQFVNRGTPTAPAVMSETADPTTAAAVGLTATGVTDPDAGDAFRYRWSFGDGSAAVTTAGPSTKHAFAKGTYDVTVRAIDLAGHESPDSAPLNVVVGDPPPAMTSSTSGSSGTPPPTVPPPTGHDNTDLEPRIAIVAPRLGQALRATALVRVRERGHLVRRRVRVPLTLSGTVTAPRGATGVALALARVQGSACRYFDGRRALRARACGDPAFFAARLSGRAWSATLAPGTALAPGTYLLIARVTDASAASARTFVRFTIR
jgi:hypothetical protein